jgi:hypothetical protein
VARYLLKNIDRAIRSKPLKESVAYINRFSETYELTDTDSEEQLCNPSNIITFYERHSL